MPSQPSEAPAGSQLPLPTGVRETPRRNGRKRRGCEGGGRRAEPSKRTAFDVDGGHSASTPPVRAGRRTYFPTEDPRAEVRDFRTLAFGQPEWLQQLLESVLLQNIQLRPRREIPRRGESFFERGECFQAQLRARPVCETPPPPFFPMTQPLYSVAPFENVAAQMPHAAGAANFWNTGFPGGSPMPAFGNSWDHGMCSTGFQLGTPGMPQSNGLKII